MESRTGSSLSIANNANPGALFIHETDVSSKNVQQIENIHINHANLQ